MRRAMRLPLEQLEPYLWHVPARGEATSAPETIDWQALYGNDHPVEIEVGFGKGLFLLNASQARPHVNFLGIEIERKYYLYSANRIAKRGLSNVRLVNGDARAMLRDHVAAASVQAVGGYFPDPWWKKRHHKRRLFTEELVQSCVRMLRSGGLFHVATDVEEYFAVIQGLLRANAALHELPTPDASEPASDMDYLTNFERKKRKEGKPIHRALFERSEDH